MPIIVLAFVVKATKEEIMKDVSRCFWSVSNDNIDAHRVREKT